MEVEQSDSTAMLVPGGTGRSRAVCRSGSRVVGAIGEGVWEPAGRRRLQPAGLPVLTRPAADREEALRGGLAGSGCLPQMSVSKAFQGKRGRNHNLRPSRARSGAGRSRPPSSGTCSRRPSRSRQLSRVRPHCERQVAPGLPGQRAGPPKPGHRAPA